MQRTQKTAPPAFAPGPRERTQLRSPRRPGALCARDLAIVNGCAIWPRLTNNSCGGQVCVTLVSYSFVYCTAMVNSVIKSPTGPRTDQGF